MKNAGVPSVVLTPADGQVTIKEPQREAIKALWAESTTGDNRGKPLVPSVALDVKHISWSPEELGLDKVREIPEARICAAIRISPMALDLKVGLERSTYSNKAEARKGAYYDCLLPLQKRFAHTLTRWLLPEHTGDSRDRLGWDYSRMLALTEDEDKRYSRISVGYKAGWLRRSDARSLAGLASRPEDEVYLTDLIPPSGQSVFGGGAQTPDANT